MFYMLNKKKFILPFSKHNSNFEEQVMITSGEGWHYIAIMLPVLLRGIISKNNCGTVV